MEKQIARVLNQHKEGILTLDAARLQLLVIFGQRKTDKCRLDRYPHECSICKNTSFTQCDGCGHFIK